MFGVKSFLLARGFFADTQGQARCGLAKGKYTGILSSSYLDPLEFCVSGHILDRLNFKRVHNIEDFKINLLKISNGNPINKNKASYADGSR